MSGIYCIFNTVNCRAYIGKATQLSARMAHHKWLLRQGEHPNPELQEDWQQFGEEAFNFSILAKNVPKEKLDKQERRFLKQFEKLGVCCNLYNAQLKGG